METTLGLPIRRACEEIGSYSGLEASKKAKTDTKSPEYSSFRTFGAFCDYYGDRLDDPWKTWRESLEKLSEECKIEEIKLYLISKGQEDAAKKIQSFEDDLAYIIEYSPEFRNKGWILCTDPSSFDKYQRLYVRDYLYGNDDTGAYCHFFLTYGADFVIPKLFKELQSLIKWDTSESELRRILDDASMRYEGIFSSVVVAIIIGEIHDVKNEEQYVKEWVSLCTKFRHEVARSERDYMEVLIDIKKKDAASFTCPGIKNVENYITLYTVKKVMEYINSSTKGEYSEEELIVRYFSLDGPLSLWLTSDTYADYLKEKTKVAKKLGQIK